MIELWNDPSEQAHIVRIFCGVTIALPIIGVLLWQTGWYVPLGNFLFSNA